METSYRFDPGHRHQKPAGQWRCGFFRGGWGRNRRRDRPKGRSSDEEAGPRTLAGASLCAACAAAGYDKKDRDALKASRPLPLRAPPGRTSVPERRPVPCPGRGCAHRFPRRRPGPVYPFSASTNAAGLTVSSAHAGAKPLFMAFLAEGILDHAQQ